jgi:hypothetical protein
MFKFLISLVLGVALGFGGGVWWANRNPDQAANLSAQEAQGLSDTIAKLKLAVHHVPGGPAPASVNAPASSDTSTDPSVQELDQKAQKQLDMLKAKLGQQ